MTALKAVTLDFGGFDRHVGLPLALLTGTGTDPKPRLRVDQSDTAFFEGSAARGVLKIIWEERQPKSPNIYG